MKNQIDQIGKLSTHLLIEGEFFCATRYFVRFYDDFEGYLVIGKYINSINRLIFY